MDAGPRGRRNPSSHTSRLIVPTLEPYMRRLLRHVQPIVVAHRAPLSVQRGDPFRGGGERLVKAAGGLVTAMSSLATSTDAVWVTVARNDDDRRLCEEAPPGEPVELVTEDGTRFRVAFVDPDSEAYNLFYNVVSNPLLWFIQHYLWDLAREPNVDTNTVRAWREGYVQVNTLLASRVAEIAGRSNKRPLVLIQDYQLYCVARLVRERLPEARLQHFVHIPWPTPQYWTILPKGIRDAIVDGILGNDIIGFQTSRDVRNFLLTCEENMGLAVDFRERTVFDGGRAVWVRNYPASVDVSALAEQADSPGVLAQEAEIAAWRPEHLILRVDRTDLSKNIVRGFLAYERLLEDHQELHGKVRFWAYLQESRQDIDDYRAYLGNILSVAARINRRYSARGWTPIRIEIDDNMERAIAGYKSFDVLLVNPIYDGMNLVAKEGALCNQRDGVLVLSENAGSHEELGELALTINPFDIDETAEALYLGIIMDQRQREARARGIRDIVRRSDTTRWIASQLQDLRELLR
ncbi:MAG TPA: trehalose-6-phosphate synthase [Candidatus Sulfotelmatobacter sp.]|nr:trehalose-6-phosphate synthase [Candidatus Sulfotelmatobacter sp.]